MKDLGLSIPLGGKRGHGRVMLVSAQDYRHMLEFKFSLHRAGYAETAGLRRYVAQNVLAHHLVIGWPPKGYAVDHINGDRLDNRRSNLRLVTVSANNQNRGARGASKFRGVSWAKGNRMWCARLRNDRKVVYCRYFHNELEAALAYDTAALRVFGPCAATNILHREGSAVTCKLQTTC